MRKIKNMFALALAMFILLSNTGECFAANPINEGNLVFESLTNLPMNGAEEFETYYKPTEHSEYRQQANVIYTYGYKYTKGNAKYGEWRTGVSGGSKRADMTLNMNKSNDTSYNISFTAGVSGSYTNGSKIGTDLGVSLGKSKTYSFGSGTSVVVPKGKHLTICYRPIYYTYTVVETKYMEQYVPGVGMKQWEVSSKTCYVDVFSHWDYTVK